mmetsp:Transcript_17366/g.51402  ORF Transcript_17366/g.51402 Transcript_17366/m.51402 type:complete len:383 (+) Transcript_17366:865-2013(+)
MHICTSVSRPPTSEGPGRLRAASGRDKANGHSLAADNDRVRKRHRTLQARGACSSLCSPAHGRGGAGDLGRSGPQPTRRRCSRNSSHRWRGDLCGAPCPRKDCQPGGGGGRWSGGRARRRSSGSSGGGGGARHGSGGGGNGGSGGGGGRGRGGGERGGGGGGGRGGGERDGGGGGATSALECGGRARGWLAAARARAPFAESVGGGGRRGSERLDVCAVRRLVPHDQHSERCHREDEDEEVAKAEGVAGRREEPRERGRIVRHDLGRRVPARDSYPAQNQRPAVVVASPQLLVQHAAREGGVGDHDGCHQRRRERRGREGEREDKDAVPAKVDGEAREPDGVRARDARQRPTYTLRAAAVSEQHVRLDEGERIFLDGDPDGE